MCAPAGHTRGIIMAINNHTDAFVKKLEDAYDEALKVDSLIAIFRETNHAEVDDGYWSYGFDILFNQANAVSTLLDELAHGARKGGAS